VPSLCTPSRASRGCASPKVSFVRAHSHPQGKSYAVFYFCLAPVLRAAGIPSADTHYSHQSGGTGTPASLASRMRAWAVYRRRFLARWLLLLSLGLAPLLRPAWFGEGFQVLSEAAKHGPASGAISGPGWSVGALVTHTEQVKKMRSTIILRFVIQLQGPM